MYFIRCHLVFCRDTQHAFLSNQTPSSEKSRSRIFTGRKFLSFFLHKNDNLHDIYTRTDFLYLWGQKYIPNEVRLGCHGKKTNKVFEFFLFLENHVSLNKFFYYFWETKTKSIRKKISIKDVKEPPSPPPSPTKNMNEFVLKHVIIKRNRKVVGKFLKWSAYNGWFGIY